jgi:hypothetical protein
MSSCDLIAASCSCEINSNSFQVHYGELDEDFLEDLSIIHRLKHPNLTPIEEVRRTPEVGCVIIYKKNSGNLRGKILAKFVDPNKS